MNLVEDPRAVGEARRYHTWAIHRDQSVGEHTWQVMRILLTVWPLAPRNVIVHALMHDGGEMSGDIQYPFKRLFPELRAGADKAEDYVRNLQRKSIGAPESKPLSAFEKLVFKACDNLEMWEMGMREVNMGNNYAKIICTRMMRALGENLQSIEELKDNQQYRQNEGVPKALHRYMMERSKMEDFDYERNPEDYDGK
jgi:5'-deoxynucleotidase YfbR-like HD superfamily hydrolase